MPFSSLVVLLILDVICSLTHSSLPYRYSSNHYQVWVRKQEHVLKIWMWYSCHHLSIILFFSIILKKPMSSLHQKICFPLHGCHLSPFSLLGFSYNQAMPFVTCHLIFFQIMVHVACYYRVHNNDATTCPFCYQVVSLPLRCQKDNKWYLRIITKISH